MMFQFGLTHKEVRGRRLPQEPRNRDLGIVRPPERAFPIIETHLSPYLIFRTAFPHPSCWRGRRPQLGDQPQDIDEQFPRHRDLSHLEGDVTAMAHNLRADLDEFLAQARQRPWLSGLGHRQRPHEVAEVVGERVKLKADGVGGEGTA